MTTKHIQILICDRCKEEFERREKYGETKTISGLQYMIHRNGAGSMYSDMALDLCAPCTTLFLAFMKGGTNDRL